MDGTNPRRPDWRNPRQTLEASSGILPEHKNTHRFGGGRPRTRLTASVWTPFSRAAHRLPVEKHWMPPNSATGSTAHDRFQEWVAAGVFVEMWKAGLLEYDYFEGIDWDWLSIDGA